MPTYKEHKILIWGKTYPELSAKYGETVCTGGVLEDGRPVRLYPIPFRYLEGAKRIKLFDVIRARLAPAQSDPRPESMRLDAESIEVIDHIPPDRRGWQRRAEWLFKDKSWQFEGCDDLMEAYQTQGRSIGVIRPVEVLDVAMEPRTEDHRETFEARAARLIDKREQTLLFETLPPEMKKLDYVSERPVITWRCSSPACGTAGGHKTHAMQVIDWGTIELFRRGGSDAVIGKLAEVLTVQEYDLKIFLGNFRTHPSRFGIVGLWYPKLQAARASDAFDLFSGNIG